MNKLIEWFSKEPTNKFEAIGFIAVSTIFIFIFWLLLSLGGCASFEKTTGYKQNTDWRIKL